MVDSYRHITAQRQGDIACVRLVKMRLDENELHQLGNELDHLSQVGGCRKIALDLMMKTPDCLYSIFLAELIKLHRRLKGGGGGLKLCACTSQVQDILHACGLLAHFDVVANTTTALAQWGASNPEVN